MEMSGCVTSTEWIQIPCSTKRIRFRSTCKDKGMLLLSWEGDCHGGRVMRRFVGFGRVIRGESGLGGNGHFFIVGKGHG